MNARKALSGALLVASIGLTLHLVFPQIPGLERSLRLIIGSSHLLVGAAFVAELGSELCYAELLGQSVGALGGRRRRGRAESADAEPRYRMTVLDRLSVSFVFSQIENRQRDKPLVPGWRMRLGSSHREVLLSSG